MVVSARRKASDVVEIHGAPPNPLRSLVGSGPISRPQLTEP